MSSVIGKNIRLSVFGESHGEAIGCVIDGLPSGIKLDMDFINAEMARRAPGRHKTSTPRKEADSPHILSGVLNGVTTGAPLAMMIENTNTKSGDYKDILTVPRPSHSDYPAYVKFGGNNDIRGGGHFSARLTAPLVFAGAIAKQILADKGITIGAHILQVGSVCDTSFDKIAVTADELTALSKKQFAVVDSAAEDKMCAEIEKYKKDINSVGGIIECAAVGLEVGLGGNIFDTVEGRLSQILFGIPAVKGVQFGLGFGFAESGAKEVNDGYEIKDGKVALTSNNNGGVLGGMTNGAPLVLSVAIKPTPSIAAPQKSVNLQTMQNTTLEIKGRHDPCILPRAVPVVESAVALGILDIIME
ncbi:MAG: chorismate synthase [Eubacterium sp.]|nr:chorismate synthase [Eubacterium sp.]